MMLTRYKPILCNDLDMIRRTPDSTALIGAGLVAIAVIVAHGIAHLLPSHATLAASLVEIALPTLAALALINRMQRTMAKMDAIVSEAHALLLRVNGPGGDHILHADHAGRISADLGAAFGNPIEFGPELVGRQLAEVCNDEGFLVEPAGGYASGRKFSVRSVPQASGNLVILREMTINQQILGQPSFVDALTGLPNRQAFLRALDASCASDQTGYVAVFAIDHLRAINDSHGDATGDAMLRTFAADAAELVRADDSLARISGGAFAVILPTADLARAEKIASRLVAKFDGSARKVGDAIVRASASAGVAPWRDNAAGTIRDAESALLIAKARDHDRYEVAGSARRRA